MGAIIYPSNIKSKTKLMNRNLAELQQDVAREKAVLTRAVSEETRSVLAGEAWGTVQNYIEGVQLPLLETMELWIREQTAANLCYYTAACLLPGDNTLDEDKLEELSAYWHRRLSREYDREDPSRSVIRRCRRMIAEINIKLTAIRVFVATVRGIYNGPLRTQEILQNARQELNGVVYHGAGQAIKMETLSGSWLLELKGAAAREYLLANGLTATEIKDLDNMGFSPEWIRGKRDMGYRPREIVEFCNYIESDTDRYFLQNLFEGTRKGYDEAFSINPYRLSDGMHLAALEHSGRLFENGDYEGLKDFNNMLFKNGLAEAVILYGDGTRTPAGLSYRDVYLQKLGAWSAIRLQESAVVLADLPEDSQEYREGLKRHNSYLNMCNLWLTEQKVLCGRLGILDKNYSYTINALAYQTNSQEFTLDMTRADTELQVEEACSLKTSIVNAEQLKTLYNSDRIKQLEKKLIETPRDYFKSAVTGIGLPILAKVHAPTAGLLSVAAMLESGSAGQVAGLEQLAESQGGKAAIGEANTIGENAINCLLKMHAINNELDTEVYKSMMQIVGTGGAYTFQTEPETLLGTGEWRDESTGISFAGLLDAGILRAMSRLETEGVKGVMGWDEDELVRVNGLLEKENVQQNKDIYEKLINGGFKFQVSGVSAEGESVITYQEFIDAKINVEKLAQKIDENVTDWTFESQVFRGGERHEQEK